MTPLNAKAGPRRAQLWFVAACLLLRWTAYGQTNTLSLHFTPADTKIGFTLGDSLHTIHGSFRLKSGDVEYDSRTGAVQGLLVVDATSGQSGSRIRDRRMHGEILESGRYPEIKFRPNRVDGRVARSGSSSVQVHGIFSIHGSDHEITVPARIEISPDHWTLDLHFNIPYVKWGIKNPSRFLLRVSESVEIDVHATGGAPFGAAHPTF